MTKSRLLRRVLPFIAVTAVGLSACGGSSPLASANDAFRVNDSRYSLTSFEALIEELVASQQLSDSNSGEPTKEDIIGVMRTLIQFEAYKQYLAANDLSETSADRKKVEDAAAADESFSNYSPELQKLLIDLSVANATMSAFKAFSSDQLKKLYNDSPASTGALCLSHILVKTEDQALAVLKDIAGGKSFESVAKAKSTDPGSAANGGALANEDEPCAQLDFFQSQFDGDFMRGAVEAKAGVPTGPIKTQFGFHIILNRPYDDIKDSLKKATAEQPGATNLAGFMTSADISINSKYGVWNNALANVQ